MRNRRSSMSSSDLTKASLNVPASSSCKHPRIVLSEDDRIGYYPQTFRIVFTSSSCKRGLIYMYYRKRGSASYIVREVLSVREREREREREIDGSDVIMVALKLAMNLHFPLPKIRTIGDEFTLSLAKNSHFSFLPSHFPSLPSRRGHSCGAEIRNEVTLSIAKKNFSLFVPPLSNGTSRATSDRKPKTNDQILPSPIIGSAEALPILCVRYFW